MWSRITNFFKPKESNITSESKNLTIPSVKEVEARFDAIFPPSSLPDEELTLVKTHVENVINAMVTRKHYDHMWLINRPYPGPGYKKIYKDNILIVWSNDNLAKIFIRRRW